MVRLLPGDPFTDPKVPEATQEKMREYIMKRPEDLEKEKEESVNEPE